MPHFQTSNKVLFGRYFGWSKEELLADLEKYKQAVAASGSRLIGASVNGQSFSYGPRERSLSQWQRELQQALAQVDPRYTAPSNTMVVRMP